MTYSATGTVTSAPAPSNAIPLTRCAPRLSRLFKSRLTPGTGKRLVTAAIPISENLKRDFIAPSLAINLSQNDIERPDDCDDVGDHFATRDVRQRRKIHKARTAKMDSCGLGPANRFYIDAEFPFRRFDR